MNAGTAVESLPTHHDLPFEDDSVPHNFIELPQIYLLTGAIRPYLDARHADGRYAIAHDSYIYWRVTANPTEGAKSPDWCYIPDVPPLLDGEPRKSYVLWHEVVSPMIVIEIVSGSGAEERDCTPMTGKFWVYERGIKAAYYAIFDPKREHIELYELVGQRYRRVAANQRGHYPVAAMGVELGLWSGVVINMEGVWLRWYDAEGRLLPTPEESAELQQGRADAEHMRAEAERRRAEAERRRADEERARAEAERARAEQLAAKLRELGVDPGA